MITRRSSGAAISSLAAKPYCEYLGVRYYEGQTHKDSAGNRYQCQIIDGNPQWVWIMGPVNNNMRALKSQSPGLCIGVSGSSTAVGAKVVQGGCVNGVVITADA